MHRPLSMIRPNMTNAILPLFLKNLSWSFLVTLAVYAMLAIFKLFNVMGWFGMSHVALLSGIVIFWLALAIIPLIFKMVYLNNVKYYFYPSHLLSEFRFFSIKRFSIPYSQIVNVTMNESLWDRMTGNGDVIIHSAENNAPDMYLYSIPNPEKIEQWLYSMIEHSKRGYYGSVRQPQQRHHHRK